MSQYKYTVTGQHKADGQYYTAECLVDGMSKYELEQFVKEQNFNPETVKVRKEKNVRNAQLRHVGTRA